MERQPSIARSLRITGVLFIIISFFVDQKVEFGLLGIAFFALGSVQFKRHR